MTTNLYSDFINPGRMVTLRKRIVELCHYDIATAYIITQIKVLYEDLMEDEYREGDWLEQSTEDWCKLLTCNKADFLKACRYIKKNKVFFMRKFTETEHEHILFKVDSDKWISFYTEGQENV